jgi:CRP-like cAMP-binding protein
MFIGVAFYSFVVGSLTSVITDIQSNEDNLIAKIKALDEFSRDTNLDKDLHKRIEKFLVNNYVELFARVDEEAMISELTPTLKEEIFYHQFGNLINDLEFLQDLENDITWGIVKNLKKVKYEHNDRVYNDGELSESLYLIFKGNIKLYAENDFPFFTYTSGNTFGLADMFCGIRRMGTATAFEDSMLYKIQKNQLDDILMDSPTARKKIVLQAFSHNKELIQARLAVLKKYPLYGYSTQQSDALMNIKKISEKMNDIHKQLLKEAKREGILIATNQIKERNKESESSSNSESDEDSQRSRGGDDSVNQENSFDDDGSPKIDKECTAIEKLLLRS